MSFADARRRGLRPWAQQGRLGGQMSEHRTHELPPPRAVLVWPTGRSVEVDLKL